MLKRKRDLGLLSMLQGIENYLDEDIAPAAVNKNDITHMFHKYFGSSLQQHCWSSLPYKTKQVATMASAPVRLSLVMKAMKTVCNHYRGVVRESKANRKKKLKERKRIRRHKFRTDMIARGLMTIEKKRKLEKEEEDESSDDYDVWSGVVNQAELDRLDGIVSEHLAVFEVSEFLLGR